MSYPTETQLSPPPGADGKIRLGAVLRGLCPFCHQGKVTQGPFAMKPRCPHCGYNLHPEPGFYLGAMVVGFLLTAMLTIPAMILLKLEGASVQVLVTFPFVEFLFLGTFLMFYCRILWVHLEYRITRRLEGRDRR